MMQQLVTSKADLWDSLIQPLDRQFGIENKVIPFHQWVENSHIIVDGTPFTYEKHEYLRDVYRDNHPFTVDMKSTQMCLTTRAMLRVVYNARFRNLRGILYLFPSRTDVSDFSKGRIDPLVEENSDTIGQWIQDTNATNIKRIWNAFLYLRGMKSRVGLKSVPADFIVYDELDEAPQNAVDMADERMSHSVFKEKAMLSNPTLPDYGIHKHFLLSDQKYWLLKCKKCNEYTDVVGTFPTSPEKGSGPLVEHRGKIILLCQHCRDNALDPAVGQWVAKKPNVKERSGRQFSQLYSQINPLPRPENPKPETRLEEIDRIFRTTSNLKDFYNLKIGIPYIEAENRLSIEEVLDLCGDEGIASSETAPCFMGVDQGKGLHVVIGKDKESKDGQIIHLEVYKDWSELDGLMKNFNVTRCVVDAQPEMRNARAFAERFKGRVFLNFYREHQKGHYKWDEGDLTVTCNRTESLDASHNEIKFERIILPRKSSIVQTFAEHLHNIGKKLEEDEETGSKHYIYVKLGEDHFRHAYNYECMARQHASGLLYPELL
jgi:hypothetical protein